MKNIWLKKNTSSGNNFYSICSIYIYDLFVFFLLLLSCITTTNFKELCMNYKKHTI